MKKKLGVVCLLAGILFLAVSGKMYLDILNEENVAAVASTEVLNKMQTEIIAKAPTLFVPELPEEESSLPRENEGLLYTPKPESTNTIKAAPQKTEIPHTVENEPEASSFVDNETEIPQPADFAASQAVEMPSMATVTIDGNAYIGYLELPTLGLSLPVMESWDYKKLKIAPCRYWGSIDDNSLIILAHNYDRHFGMIKTMQPGDMAQFVDVDGNITTYSVMEVTIMEPNQTEEMVEKSGDLTLFTCTKGGKHRVTVRLDRIY